MASPESGPLVTTECGRAVLTELLRRMAPDSGTVDPGYLRRTVRRG